KIRDITDGTSSTILLAETCQAGFYNGPPGTCGTGKLRLSGGSPFTPHAAFLALTFDTALASGNGFYFNQNGSVYTHPDGSPITGFFLKPASTSHNLFGPWYCYGGGWAATTYDAPPSGTGLYGAGSIHS